MCYEKHICMCYESYVKLENISNFIWKSTWKGFLLTILMKHSNSRKLEYLDAEVLRSTTFWGMSVRLWEEQINIYKCTSPHLSKLLPGYFYSSPYETYLEAEKKGPCMWVIIKELTVINCVNCNSVLFQTFIFWTSFLIYLSIIHS